MAGTFCILNFPASILNLPASVATHLDGHGPHDCPLVPLERLQRHLRDLLVRLAQELLARRQQHLLVLTLDLDLRRQIRMLISLLASECQNLEVTNDNYSVNRLLCHKSEHAI